MATFATLDPQDTVFHLKARRAVTLIAPMSVEFPSKVTTTGVLDELTGFLPTGRTSRDGVTFPRSISTEDQLSHGYLEPSQSDRTEDTTQINVTFQQANARVFALYTGASLDAMKRNANGELWLPRAQVPVDQEYRWITICQDFNKATGQPVYFGKAFPRVKVTEPGEQSFPGEGWVEWPVTMTAFHDSAAGTAVVDFIAGAGFTAAATGLGFAAAS